MNEAIFLIGLKDSWRLFYLLKYFFPIDSMVFRMSQWFFVTYKKGIKLIALITHFSYLHFKILSIFFFSGFSSLKGGKLGKISHDMISVKKLFIFFFHYFSYWYSICTFIYPFTYFLRTLQCCRKKLFNHTADSNSLSLFFVG